MLTLATACGQGADETVAPQEVIEDADTTPQEVTEAPDTATDEQEPTEPAGDRPFEGTTITLMGDNRNEFDLMLELLPEFTERTGIELNFIQLQETPLRSRTGLELSAPSTDVDVIMMDFTFTYRFAEAGLLVALDDFLDEIPTFNRDDFIPAFLDGVSFEGRLYALPTYQDCSILMYRADIFAELGLDVPTTFDELESVAAAIQEAHPDMTGITMRGMRGLGVNEWTWPTVLWGFGGRYYDDNYNATLNSPEAIAALEWYARILENYGPAGVANYSYVEVQTAMMTGRTGMILDSATLGIRIEDPNVSQTAGLIGYAVVPSQPPHSPQPGFFSWTLAIPKNSHNHAAAAEFIAWFMSPEIAPQVNWSAPNQALETVYAIPAYPGFDQSVPLYDVMIESLQLANPDFRPRMAIGTEISTRVSEAISSVLAGETDAATALEAANADVDNLLREAGLQQ